MFFTADPFAWGPPARMVQPQVYYYPRAAAAPHAYAVDADEDDSDEGGEPYADPRLAYYYPFGAHLVR